MLGVNRGFMAAHRTDAWQYTAPAQVPRTGLYVVGGAWCAQHLMEHYRFTQDRAFLQDRAFPILRGAALFFVDWLVPDPKTGKLVSGPSGSPENRFKTPDGKISSITMGPSHDQEIIWNAFRDYLEACRVLGIENAETREVKQALEKLALPKIGSDGRLQEWSEEFEEPEPGHRHLSHLWGMMPGNRITLQQTPELADAVRKSLDYRLSHNYSAQGWSLGWTACLMARMREGDRALDVMNHEYFSKAWPNMFVNAHGQVQVGDMMGVPLAMIELLLQSHADAIDLLPALPKQWATGSVTGLCARGGYVIDLAWANGKLTAATVQAKTAGTCKVRYGDKTLEVKTEAGKKYPLKF
jgi:alpha-L-fucosidase 2